MNLSICFFDGRHEPEEWLVLLLLVEDLNLKAIINDLKRKAIIIDITIIEAAMSK